MSHLHRLVATLLLLAAFSLALPAAAKTLRWASQGDPQTMDPHSQNESMTNMMNGQVYEGLISRGKNLELVPALATEWQQVSPLVLQAGEVLERVAIDDQQVRQIARPYPADAVVHPQQFS